MSRLHPFGVRMPTRPDYSLQTPTTQQPPKKRTDTYKAYLELVNATTAPTERHTVPCDEPLPYKPYQDSEYLPSSKTFTIFEDSTATPNQLRNERISKNEEITRKRARNVKLEMLIHLNKCEYKYMQAILDWLLPVAQEMDEKCGGSMVLLINNYKHNCHFFETSYLTNPVNAMRKARAEGRTRKFENMQNLVEKTVMNCHMHITMLLDTITMVSKRAEVARGNGFDFTLPETAEVPECARAVMEYVSARGWGVCIDRKDMDYWMIRRAAWGEITQIHLGFDLVRDNEIERGNFQPWMSAMIEAVEDNVDKQELQAWKSQERDALNVFAPGFDSKVHALTEGSMMEDN